MGFMSCPSLEELDLLHAHVCQAFSDPRRMLILYALHENPQNGSELAAQLEMPQPTVARHLRFLHQRGLLVSSREGRTVVYRLADDRLIDVIDTMRGLVKTILTARVNTFRSD